MANDLAQRVMHVRFEGRSVDVALADLEVRFGASDDEVKRAVARYLDIGESRLRDFTVDRHATGNVTLRPEAVFG